MKMTMMTTKIVLILILMILLIMMRMCVDEVEAMIRMPATRAGW